MARSKIGTAIAKNAKGVKVRITAKQLAARKRNIAIARKAKKRAGAGGFSKSAISRMTKGGKGMSKKEAVSMLTSAIKAGAAKRTRRAKQRAASGEAYSKRKRLRKKAEMFMLKKMGF